MVGEDAAAGVSSDAAAGVAAGDAADVVAGDKPELTFESIAWANPWLLESKLVVKPDQLIKRRGKAGLIGVNLNWEEVQAWITERVYDCCWWCNGIQYSAA